ncbi:NAD(P)/FAD-dependent oxidoreductase [Thermoproteota archaeon]
MHDTIIIGGGPGGYSAAIYAARFNMDTVILAKQRGGLIAQTHLVENWPGEKSISGFDLIAKVEEHVKHFNVPIKDEVVEDITKSDDSFVVKTSKEEYKTKTVIIATGTVHRKLPVTGEKEFYGKGVSYCATCDGMFFRDKVVAIIGGSDSAAKEALLLSEHCKKVYIIYRREKIRAEPINYDRVMKKVEDGKIEIIYKTNLTEIKGDKMVTSVMLDNPYNDSSELKLDGVFGAIGHIPQAEFARNIGIEFNKREEIITDKHSNTNVPGIYAAGDVTDGDFKQAITAAAQGVMATKSAFEYMSK